MINISTISTDVDIIAEVIHLVYSAAMSDGHAEPAQSAKETDAMAFITTNMMLVIFSADVDVRPDKKMFTELCRSMKKHPPTELKYELTYVSPISDISGAELTLEIYIDVEGRISSFQNCREALSPYTKYFSGPSGSY